MTDSASHKQYVVVYRAVSALRFTEDGYFKFNGVRTPNGTVDLTFGTRYDDAGFESKIPRELWIDARGSAPSLEHAINDFGASASMFLQLLTVSENAAIFHPAVHLAYDASEGATERDFFQSFLVDERGIPRITRRFHAQASRAFVEGVSRLEDPDRDRVLRACSQYQQALMYWDPGQELLAFAHLYMGVEAITEVVLRDLCRKHATDESGLPTILGIEGAIPARCPTCGQRPQDLLGRAIRRKVIFQGDDACYKDARFASNAFEHGFQAFGELHAIAVNRRDLTARYLREAIIDVLHCEGESKEALLTDKRVAVGGWRPARYFRGKLIGEGSELAEPTQAYPILNWKSSIQKAAPTPDGGIAITPLEQFTPRLAEGISLKPGSYEMWGPENDAKRDAPKAKATLEPLITKALKLDPKFERVRDILRRIKDSVLAYGPNQEFPGTLTDSTVLAFFAECRSQFQAVVNLLDQRLANEALLVARGIFCNSQRLRFLAATEHKAPIVFGWVRDSLKSAVDVDYAAVDAGFDDGSHQEMPGFEAREKGMSEFAERNNMKLTGFPLSDLDLMPISSLAKLGYLASSRIINGFGATMAYTKEPGTKTVGFNNICEDMNYIEFVAAFGAESVLLASQAAGKVFGWPEFPDFDRLLQLVQTRSFGESTGFGVSNDTAVSSGAYSH